MDKSEIRQHTSFHDPSKDLDFLFLTRVITRRWKAILAVTMIFVAAVGAVTVWGITPTYQSSAVVMFRSDNPWGIDFGAFHVLAASPRVLLRVIEEVDAPWTLRELEKRFQFKADSTTRQLTVVSRADDPILAARLVESWIDSIRIEVSTMIGDRLAERLQTSELNYEAALDALNDLEASLARLDQEYPIALMESRVERDIRELVAAEGLLEDTKLEIPVNEAHVESLREALKEGAETLSLAQDMEPEGADRFLLTQLVSTYLEIRWRLAEAESTLVADRRRIEVLEDAISELESRVLQTRAELIDVRRQRERFVRAINEARNRYESILREREAVLALERRLPELTRVEVLTQPVVPNGPVSPRLMLNLVVGTALGSIVAVFGAVFAELWRVERENRTHKLDAA